jgi:hypothetical protein
VFSLPRQITHTSEQPQGTRFSIRPGSPAAASRIMSSALSLAALTVDTVRQYTLHATTVFRLDS